MPLIKQKQVYQQAHHTNSDVLLILDTRDQHCHTASPTGKPSSGCLREARSCAHPWVPIHTCPQRCQRLCSS